MLYWHLAIPHFHTTFWLNWLLSKLHRCFDWVGRHNCKSRLAFPQSRYAFRIGIPSWRLSTTLKRVILFDPYLFNIKFLQILVWLNGSCCLVYHCVIIILFLVVHSDLCRRLNLTIIVLFWRLNLELRLFLWCILRKFHWLSLISLHWLLVWHIHWLFLRNLHRLYFRSFRIAYGIGIHRGLNTLISNCCNGFFGVFGLLALVLCQFKFFLLRVFIDLANWCFRFISRTFYTLVIINRCLWSIFTHWLLFTW